jgi:hypothetical protein
MHLETTQTVADNDEQSSICFSDLYNLYEIIGKYGKSFYLRLLIEFYFFLKGGHLV